MLASAEETTDANSVGVLNNGTELIVATKSNQRPTRPPSAYHRVKSGPTRDEAMEDSCFVTIDKGIATKLGIQNNDIIQVVHLLRIRSEKVNAQDAAHKQFEETKAKV
jgi:hypothetical protein